MGTNTSIEMAVEASESDETVYERPSRADREDKTRRKSNMGPKATGESDERNPKDAARPVNSCSRELSYSTMLSFPARASLCCFSPSILI